MTHNFPLPQPTSIWHHFFELVRVPRPSKAETAAIEYLASWANSLGFESRRDTAGNLVVHVPSTQSNTPTVILQCHVDIVAVTASDAGEAADAMLGIIPLVRGNLDPKNPKALVPDDQGDWINSPFTTLGADNGIGVAMMMALAESELRPVALELLFTIDEEAGMTGASGLDPDALELSGNIMINIDTEDDSEITIGAAGGRDVEIQWNGEWMDGQGLASYQLSISGLKGGHSGIEINQGRANANRLLARLMQRLANQHSVYIQEIQGGSRRNAIPDTCNIVFSGAPIHLADWQQIVTIAVAEWNALYANRDNLISISLRPLSEHTSRPALTAASSLSLVRTLTSIPTGICEMTPEIPLLVESSCNLAIVQLEPGQQAKIICSVRGTTAPNLNDITDSLSAIASLVKGTVTISDGYPGWKPNLDSSLLRIAIEQYSTLFGEQPQVHAVHAGLECGLLLEKLPKRDVISIGPTIKGNHAVGERVQISSVDKSYRYLVAILKQIASS